MSQSRREHILSLAGALFARKGVAATTVREIADEVGILSGSLYHHFESKEAIVDEIIAAYLADLRSRYRAALVGVDAPADRLRRLIQASLETAAAHPDATTIYQNEINHHRGSDRFGHLKEAGREVQRTWLSVIEAGVADGSFRADVDPKTFYRLTRDAMWLSIRWFKPTGRYPLKQFAADCAEVFLAGIAAKR
jgi:AcrR family transcriptional regulator